MSEKESSRIVGMIENIVLSPFWRASDGQGYLDRGSWKVMSEGICLTSFYE